MAITAEHVEELTRKLLSDRQKEREAGLRDLKSYLNIKEFCSLLDEQTEEIPRQGPIPSSTWPGVVHALCESIAAYLKTPKKKGPNIEYAKTLKNLVKKACSSDKRLLLIRKVRYLYQHLAAVICSVPSFESDYCSIVLVLLNEVEYRLCMSKKIYGELVDFLVSKRTSAANNESTGALLSLIKHPPGDLPDTLRPAIITSLSEVFLHISDSKNLLRKLLESVTGLLRHDGPNLGESLSEIHSSARKCLIRAWPTLNDDSHKELFLLYLRMQLKLRVIIVDDQGGNLQEMLELVEKELDGMAWDTKAVSLARPLLSLLRLAASVIYEVLRKGSSYTGHNVKRRRKENMDAVLKDRVKDAKSLWVGAVCLLIKHYGPKIPTELLYDLLNGLVSSLERLSTDAINSGTFEAPLWTVRCLNEACDMVDATCHGGKLWQSIWHAMVRWILLMSAIPQLVEEALKLLGCLAMKNLVLVYTIPNEFWDLHLFKELPTRNALFFVAAFFSTYGCQLEDLELRKTLLCWCSTALNLEAKHNAEGRIPPKILTGAFLALSIGSTGCTMTEIADALWSWSEPEEQDRIQEAELAALDHAEEVLAACGIPDELKANTLCKRMSLIGLASSDSLLQVLADNLLQTIQAVQESKDQRLEVLLHLCTVISYCLHEVGFSRQKRGQRLNIWSHDGNVCKGLGVLVQCCVALLEEIGSIADTRKQLTDKAVRALHEFVLVPNVHASADAEGVNGGFTSSLETLMKAILQRLCSIPEVDGSIVMSPASTEASCLQRIMDAELDIEEAHTHMETKCGSHGNWKSICISMISVLGEVLPESAFHALQKALPAEQDPKVREEILLSMCKVFRASVLVAELPLMVDLMRGSLEKGQHSEAGCHQTLTAAQLILSELNSEKARTKSKLPVQPQVLSELLKVIEDVAKVRILQWPTRSKLGEVTSSFLLLDPELAQGLTHIFLELLHDPDFRVRISHSSRISVLFETWNGHHGLLQDVCLNLGVKMPMATRFEVISAAEACQSGGSIKDTWTKTALVTIGEVAAASEKVEIEAVFMILAQSALQPTQRMLAAAIISRLAKRLGYPDGWKFLEQLIRGIFSRWVVTAMPLPGLMEIREILVRRADLSNFLHHCTPFLLPHLLLHGRDAELHWLAQATSTSVKSMVKEHFASTFAALLPLHCDSNAMEMDRVSAVLQGSMLASSGLTGGERDDLIKKLMVSIIIHIFQLVSAEDNPEMPYFSKDAAITGVKTAVDGLFEDNRTSQDRTIVDKLQIFRADRVFQILLQIHDQAASSCHSRHRRHSLIRLETLIEIIDNKVLVPSTFRYLIHIILQSTEMVELQGQCCSLISQIIKKLENPSSSWILGEQLQSLVSRLVSCSISSYGTAEQKRLGRDMHGPAPAVIDLLHRLTAGADANLHQYIKELDPFPDIPCFEPIRKLQLELRSTSTFPAEFVKFVRRAPFLPSQLRLWSLQSFCNQLRERREELRSGTGKQARDHWFCSDDVVIAVWELVLLCNEEDDNDIRNLTAEFLAAAGIGDPDAVVFHLPDASKNFLLPSSRSRNNEIISIDPETGISEDIARVVLTQLCNCLLDKDVSVIDLASKTVKGLLSTEKGYRVLGKLNTHDKAYLEVHTKGVNLKLVEDMLTVNRLESSNKAVPIEDSSLWSTSGKTYDVWISTLVHSLIEFTEDSFLRLCQGLILVKATLAELLLPHVLGCLAGKLQTSSKLYSEVVAQVQRHIFSDSNKNTRSIQVFLEALNGLRVCHVNAARNAPSKRQGNVKVAQGLLEWPKVYWMDVDYLLTAKAAQKCAAYFTSVLYVEHWCEEKFGRLTLGDPQLCDDNQLSEHLELLLAVYTKANEPDGVYGIVRAHKPVSQVRLYEHEGNWGKALETYDLLLRSSSVHPPEAKTPYYKGVVKALQQIGCSRVNEMYCTGLAKSNLELTNDMEFRELQYETAWRSGKWDLNVVDLSPVAVNVDGTLDLGFHGKLHSSFKCLMEGDSDKFQSHVKQMKEELISHVVHTSLESTQNVHPAIVKLQVVDSLSQAWDLRWPSSGSFRPAIPPNNQMRTFLTSWKQMFKQTRENYNLLEPFGSFLKVLFKVLERDDHLPSQLVQHAVLARKAGRLNHAAVAIQELKDFCNKRVEDEGAQSFLRAGRIEEAKVLWAQGQQEMAVTLLKYLLSQIEHTANATALYCLAGKWLAETRSASSRVIMESYFQKSVEMAESACISNPHNKEFIRRKCKTHFHLAHFANALYQSYEDRLHSNEWQAALRLRNHKAKEFDALLKKLKETQGDKRDYSIKAAELQKQLKMDVDEESRLHADRAHFLHVSLVNYRSCLLTSDKYDIRVVFRLVSLWFDLSTDQKVVADMLLSVQKVQSFKFLPLVYQIASRMGPSKSSNDFQFVVNLLVRKMAIEHPYHSLYQLLALANGDRIKDNQKRKQAFVIDLDKKHAAEELLNQLSAHHHSELILQVKRMVEIYIKLAELEVKKGDPSNKIPIPRDIRSVRQLEQVPVITANVAVDRSCKYPDQSFPYFKGFVDQITIMNGINAPKVVDCLGSDGRKYRQLAKSGDDDLRQDAVMEQLFGLVNTLLKHHPETRKRCLQVRTYKVIPFTPSAGALEWVDGTIPLGEYLLGSTREGGAHSRYGSGDWPFMKCRQHMTSEENKSAAFQTVYKNFRPVMRFFFRENFKQAADWFEKRLTYTRSVAASSMVGYIIGLGDRHAMNILIDQASAEVVHIDLGVAFEQGLMLKTPERIPFRLTRDIVDGMGVSGVEGVFRRCCEATLSVMRANKEALLTIVEVFIHDPLYKWALSPLKALQKQKEVEGLDEEFAGLDRSEVDVEGNKDAARALLRVKQKLDGYEDGEMRTVQGQVQQLIQDAQDPERLCQLFPGWGAWL